MSDEQRFENQNQRTVGISGFDEIEIRVNGVLFIPSVAIDDERYERVDSGLNSKRNSLNNNRSSRFVNVRK